jgi:[ribosomal protein S18]-alanine N-acetyltransferase
MTEILAMPRVFGRVAFAFDGTENASPLGLALAQCPGPECELLTLGVMPAERRNGVGRALLHSIIDEARQQSAHTLFLDVAEDNLPARALYAACGFVEIGRRPNYYSRRSGLVDALTLRLLLAT